MNKDDYMAGYLRKDGRKGVRNSLIVAYTVECAHHVAREIMYPYRDDGVQLIGFGGCAPNEYANDMMTKLCTHPNVGAVLLISLGCENLDKHKIAKAVDESGRPVHILTIQKSGGTRTTIKMGLEWVKKVLNTLKRTQKVPMNINELSIGTICGGSDATSGITANPAIGRTLNGLIEKGATAIFEETGELIGCEHLMAERANSQEVSTKLIAVVNKAKKYYSAMGYSSFSVGNSDGGLSTIEEKSLGAYSKSGDSKIMDVLVPGEIPEHPGLYLLDVVPEGVPKYGWPNINDSAEIGELIACGAHIILFSTGRGSVVGSAISPVIKICANPETYKNMKEDMDINAGAIIAGTSTLERVQDEIYNCILQVCNGTQTVSEAMGHQEFVLTYKQFDTADIPCHKR